MPLKCLAHGSPIYSFDYTDDEWDLLKQSHRENLHLSMPCCSALAVLKVSKLGTKFFAHKHLGDCASSPETAEHLLAKFIVAKASCLAGWSTETEAQGTHPSGAAWVADVLAMKGKGKVAFEIQWSQQSTKETQRRQTQYAESGVRGLWLLRHPDLLIDHGTPTFRLFYDIEALAFFVLLPSPCFPQAIRLGRLEKNEAVYWQQKIELGDFVLGALNGALRFAPAVGIQLPAVVHISPTVCWKCKKTTSIVKQVKFEASKALSGHPDIHADIYDLEKASEGNCWLEEIFPEDFCIKHKIGEVKVRYSRTVGHGYLSNGCFHCDALQGRFFEHEQWDEGIPAYSVHTQISKPSAVTFQDCDSEIDREIFLWWFDAERSASIKAGIMAQKELLPV